MKDHLNECPKTNLTKKVNGFMKNELNTEFGRIEDVEKRFLLLEQDIGLLRSTINEEIRQRLHLITDVGNLRKKNLIADEWTQKVSDVLNALKKCLNDETQNRSIDVKKLNEDISKCVITLQVSFFLQKYNIKLNIILL